MSNTYCVLPFIHMATDRGGSYVPCSSSIEDTGFKVGSTSSEIVWHSEYYKQLRQDLLNGVRHPNCQSCWDAEDRGFTSKRQRQNSRNEFYSEPLPSPIEVDVKTGNACNLKCMTCNQLSSSQIDKEVNTWRDKDVIIPVWLDTVGKQFKVFNPDNAERIPENLAWALRSAKVLQIHGGEPFASLITSNLLWDCIRHEYFDLCITMVTNLSSITDKLLSKIALFPNSNIGISYDHVDSDKWHYIRYPATYDHFTKNLTSVIEGKKFGWSISFTISIFNAMDLDAIFAEFDNIIQSATFKSAFVNPVIEPNYFSIQYLELEQKQQMVADINNALIKYTHLNQQPDFVAVLNDICKVIYDVQDDFDSVVKERTRVLDLYDATRGTDWQKLFPYIKRY